MQILNTKLKRLKEDLKVWNKTEFGNVHYLVNTVVTHPDTIQLSININGCIDDHVHQEKLVEIS